MLIRKATKDDLPQVSQIYDDIHTQEEQGIVSIGWIRGVYPTFATAEHAMQEGELFVGEDGSVVGAAIINQKQVPSYREGTWNYDAPDQEIMVLHTLVISPNAAGKGCGREFVRFYEEYALAHNCHYLRMDTNAINSRARAMYKKLGYREIGIIPTVFNGIEGVQLVLLEKYLGTDSVPLFPLQTILPYFPG